MVSFEIQLNAFCIMILLQTYGSQGLEYGGLNVVGPCNLKGSGTLRRCGFVGVGVALLEKTCHCGGQFLRFPMLRTSPGISADFSRTMSVCTLPCSCRDNGLNL